MNMLRTSVLFLAFTLFAAPSPAAAQGPGTVPVPPASDPAGDALYFRPAEPPVVSQDPSWIVRTGMKKGVRGAELDAERFAGPDAAVLRSGFFRPWSGLLAGFREASVFVEPDGIAGLEKTKPYLIIPSGGLHGFAGSAFFRAGLAEYARSGGVILCFAQQDGDDVAALPAPAGSPIKAAGWEEDSGPLFRASSVQGSHPSLAGTVKTAPEIETSGYVTAFPPDAKILLSRIDGYPTLIVYPFGEGWVAVTTMFPGFSFGYGDLEPAERTLVHNLVLWAKSPKETMEAAPGEQIGFPLELQGPDRGEAASAVIAVEGPEGNRVGPARRIAVSLKAGQSARVTFPYTVPSSIQPGIYHVEYVLHDAAGGVLTERAECRGGRFSIGQPTAAAAFPRLQQPMNDLPAKLLVRPRVVRTGGSVRISLDVLPAPGPAPATNRVLFARIRGQEKLFAIGKSGVTVSFDVPARTAGDRIAYVVYESNGRSAARGAVSLPSDSAHAALDRPFYLPGEQATIQLTGLGSGELTLVGPGYVTNRMITGSGSASFAIPAALPAGTYTVRWMLKSVDGKSEDGELPVNIAAYRVGIVNASLDRDGDEGSFSLRLRIRSPRKLAAQMKIALRGPDGVLIPADEGPVSLDEGIQEVTFPVSFKPGEAGIWEVRYALAQQLPAAPGLPAEPVTLAEGRVLFDSGDAAVLGVATDRPVYYDPAGPVGIAAYVYGKGRAVVELSLDGSRAGREKLSLDGAEQAAFTLPDPGPGMHVAKVTATADGRTSAATRPFVYGSRFPDLTAVIQPGEPADGVMPVSVIVNNSGKTASPPCRVALFEGDPDRGGALIGEAPVPALEPDGRHTAVVDWTLIRRAGARTLVAVVDADGKVVELDKLNNRASVDVTVPDVSLAVIPRKKTLHADEPIAYTLSAVNFTDRPFRNLDLRTAVEGPAGNVLSSETVTIADLTPGAQRTVDRTLDRTGLAVGAYRLRAGLSARAQQAAVASASSTVTVLPTLLISGDLDATPATAALCMPFTITYHAENTGNVPLTSGSLGVVIKTSSTGQTVFARQLPFLKGLEPVTIESMAFSQGSYTISLKAEAASRQYSLSKEFMLAEQPLTVVSPAEIRKGKGQYPRVLVWSGRPKAVLDEAIAGSVVKQAFDDDDLSYRVVHSAEDFENQALSGRFNTYVLFEIDELPAGFDWLKDRVSRGSGIVIIGSDERSRVAAESFGFRFDEGPRQAGGTMLSFTGDAGTGLAGTLPVSGPLLLPRRKDGRPLALFSAGNEPAVILGDEGSGKAIVMPFSVVRSARDAGTTPLYSLLLKAAVRIAAPEGPERGRVRGQELSLTATDGPVQARIIVTLPRGAHPLEASEGGVTGKNTIVFEATAEREPQTLRYLYRLPDGSDDQPIVELFTECDGSMANRGRVE